MPSQRVIKLSLLLANKNHFMLLLETFEQIPRKLGKKTVIMLLTVVENNSYACNENSYCFAIMNYTK